MSTPPTAPTPPATRAPGPTVPIPPTAPTTAPAPTQPPVATPEATSAPAAPIATPPPLATPIDAALRNKRGVHLLLDDGGSRWPAEVWEEHIEWAAHLIGPGGYVVQLIRSTDLRPEIWQAFFDLAAREGLIPIVRLATYKEARSRWWVAPEPDADGLSYREEADRFRRFFDAIVWRTDRVIVTVGNEPNRPDEWSGAPDPAAYARYLRDMSAGLRRVSAVRVIILNAGLDAYAPSTAGPTNYSIDSERFMEGMVTEVPGIFEQLEGWASHAYPLGPFGEHPGRQEFRIDDVRPDANARPSPPEGLPNRGVNGYVWELWKLGQLGVGRPLPVYVTESGWRHLTSQAATSLDAPHATVEDERFADYLGLAFDGPAEGAAVGWTPWNLDPRVRAVALFALGGRPDQWGHTYLLLLDPIGRILGAYPFAERLATVSPGPSSRPRPRDADTR